MIIDCVKIEWISDHKGYGLIATKDIPKGTITFVQDGLDIIVTPAKLKKLSPHLLKYVEKYSFEDYLGNLIISWDLGKYMNHDDNANTLTTGYGFEVAIRDIKKGEEVTDDYRIFSTHHDTSFSASQEALDSFHPWPVELIELWDARIKDALENFERVEQTLIELIPQKSYQQLLKYFDSKSQYRSVAKSLPLRYWQRQGQMEL